MKKHKAGDAVWRHPDDDPPPLGEKILILTTSLICVIGQWDKHGRYRAWAPLPKIDPALKARLYKEDDDARRATVSAQH